MTHIVVAGYGIHDEQYGSYLDFVAGIATAQTDDVHIVLCGGCTDNKWPGRSEAMVMHKLLKRHAIISRCLVSREEASIDTLGNMLNARRIIGEHDRSGEVIVVGDKARRFALYWLAKRVFGRQTTVMLYNFNRPAKERLLSALVGYPKAVLSYYGLHRLFYLLKRWLFLRP